MICADLFLLLFAIFQVQQTDVSKRANYYGNQLSTDSLCNFIAIISELPAEKEKFVKCELTLLEVKNAGGYQTSEGKIYAYFRKSKAVKSLAAGQTLLIKTQLREVAAPKNPFEFDYRNYLRNKQIFHTAFIDSDGFQPLPLSSRLNPVWGFGLACKSYLLTHLKNSDLSPNAYGICAALLTGYDDDIDKPVMEAFSHSGTLHVLSVSGLHTGLIYLALNFIFNFFDRNKKYKLARLLFITLFLWFFALITGFSAPVLRAVVMFTLLGFGRIYFRARYSHQLNILLVSAFLLLAYNPFYLMDVGFLLSYFALFGLLYFQPRISAAWTPEHKVTDALWQSVTASVAATISTLPITLFYFKQFPLWFFVCNVVVVPATFVILMMAVFVVLKVNFMALLINYLVALLIRFIELFNSKNFGFIDNIHFTFSDVFFLSVLIILLSVAFQYRTYKYLVQSILLLITWQLFSLLHSFVLKQESLLTVYNVKHKPAISIKNKTLVYLDSIQASTYNFSVKPHVNSFNYPDVKTCSFNVLRKDRQLMVFLNKPGYWPSVDLSKVTTLVLSNNFKISETDLRKMEGLKTLVVDATNNNYSAAKTEQLCRNFGISFYNTKYEGAYLLTLQ